MRLGRRLVPTHRRPGEIDPDLYGAAESLRELAAEARLPEYFQRSDAELYIQVLEQAVLRGVTEFLKAKGYSVATVREVAHTTITNNVYGRDFNGANIGIEHNTQHNHYGSATGTASLDALRAALDEHGDRVVALGRTADEQVALRHEIAATRRELGADKPDGVAVRVRWQVVLATLGATLAMNADVAQITQFIMDLFAR